MPPGQERQVDLRTASDTDYFHAMQIPLIKGRFFTEHDTADLPGIVIIDEKIRTTFLAERRCHRKTLTCGFDPKRTVETVGVVGTVKQYGLETDGKIATYFPQQQRSLDWDVSRGALGNPTQYRTILGYRARNPLG